MKKYLFVCGLLVSSVSHSNAGLDMSRDQLSVVNWLLQCPTEVSQALKQNWWVGSGRIVSTGNGEMASFRFYRRAGLANTEYVNTLNIERINLKDPPQDAPGFRVECSFE